MAAMVRQISAPILVRSSFQVSLVRKSVARRPEIANSDA
jgi:hypothetical protein